MIIWLIALAAISLSTSPEAHSQAAWGVIKQNDEICGMGAQFKEEGIAIIIVQRDIYGDTGLRIASENWSIEEGRSYSAAADIDGMSFPAIKALGHRAPWLGGELAMALPDGFLDMLAEGKNLNITIDDKLVTRLALDNNRKAVADLKTCVGALIEEEMQRRDDIRDMEVVPVDPFAVKDVKSTPQK